MTFIFFRRLKERKSSRYAAAVGIRSNILRIKAQKSGGYFIFSWGHPLHYCVAKSYETGEDVVDNGALVFSRSYFDESYLKMPVHDTTVTFANRKISTYVNALYDAGFIIEKMIEQTDEKSLADTEDNSPKAQKAKMVPLSMCFKCRKL